MTDYLGNEIEVGDIILMCNRSVLQKHVVVSIPSHNNSITVSTCRQRVSRGKGIWHGKQYKYEQVPIWEVWNNSRIAEHNSKINKWARANRIVKLDEEFRGDLSQFKTVKQLEKEFKKEFEVNKV